MGAAAAAAGSLERARPSAPAGTDGIPDAGAVRNTVLQFASQLVGLVFTGALTLVLVRVLGASGYGIYGLAVGVGGLLVLPAGLGLPMAVGRYLAEHRNDRAQAALILSLGLRLQLPVALVASAALFVLAAPIAHAYSHPRLLWPLRWMAVAIAGQCVFNLLAAAAASLRQSAIALRISVVESVLEATSAIALVLAGAGAAGAAVGRAIGYVGASLAGLYLSARLLGRRGRDHARAAAVGPRRLLGYAGQMLAIDVGFSVIAQLDTLMIGALLSAAAVGQFSAVLRVLAVFSYVGLAVASGVAPRVAAGGDGPDRDSFSVALRLLIITQGLVIAPMLVWPGPIVALLLGSGYQRSPAVMRALTPFYFLAGPAGLITVSVTYLGAGAKRVVIVVVTLVVALAATYGLLRAVGLVGAAYGDDVLEVVWVLSHLWICHRLLGLDLRAIGVSVSRTLVGAGAMALVLWAVGTESLSVWQWVGGLLAALAAYVGALLLTRELTVAELRLLGARLRAATLSKR